MTANQTETRSRPTLMDELRTAGCKIDTYNSDLHVEDTPLSREILSRWSVVFYPFVSQKPEDKGSPWLDIPFMNTEYKKKTS